MRKITFVSKNAIQTKNLGSNIAKIIPNGTIVFLIGELGSGKTTFVSGFVEGKEITEHRVSSPTFVTQNIYPYKSGSIFHYDLYKTSDNTLMRNDFREHMKDSIFLIEWADRLDMEISPSIVIKFEYLALESRIMNITGTDKLTSEIAKCLDSEPVSEKFRYILKG